jgi:hypothetical protein
MCQSAGINSVNTLTKVVKCQISKKTTLRYSLNGFSLCFSGVNDKWKFQFNCHLTLSSKCSKLLIARAEIVMKVQSVKKCVTIHLQHCDTTKLTHTLPTQRISCAIATVAYSSPTPHSNPLRCAGVTQMHHSQAAVEATQCARP